SGDFQPMKHGHGPVAVLGAGSWGTALAIQFARSGHLTRFWGRNRAALAAMATSRRNERYLSAEFPASLVIEPDLGAASDSGYAACLGHEGLRARHRAAAAPGCTRSTRVKPRGSSALRAHVCARGRRRFAY